MAEINVIYKSNIDEFTKDVNKNVAAQKNLDTQIDKQKASVEKLTRELSRLQVERSRTNDPTQIKKLTQAIKDQTFVIKRRTGEIKKTGTEIQKVSKQTSNLSGNLRKMAGVLGIAFGVQQLLRFGKELLDLTGKAEGIQEAFERIGDAELLAGLRESTQGTISDLELMKQAVRAENFNIPLTQLATLFEFATKRAAATGESVDFLVDSIVKGIGRKSPKILDNLGIGLLELQKAADKTGDVGKAAFDIIIKELVEMGDVTFTTAQLLAKLEAQTENLKLSLANQLKGAFDETAEAASEFVASLNDSSKQGIILKGIISVLGLAFDAVKVSVKTLINITKALFLPIKVVANFLQETFTPAFEAIAFLFEKRVLPVFRKVNNAIKGTVKTLLAFGEKALSKVGLEIDLTGKALSLYNKVLGTTEDNTKEVTKQTDKSTTAFEENTDAIDAETEALEKLTEAQKKSIDTNIEAVNQSVEGTNKTLENREKELARFKSDERLKNDIRQENTEKALGIIQAFEEQASAIIGIFADINEARKNREIQKAAGDERKIEQIERKAFKRDQALAVVEIAIQTATAIAKSVALSPATFGAPFSIVAAATGAAQTALVLAQKFAEGVIDLKGPGTGTSDSIPARLSKGESVMTAKETKEHRPVLTAIRGGKFEDLIKEQYIAPELEKMRLQSQVIVQRQDDTEQQNRLYKAVRNNKKVQLENVEELAASIADKMDGDSQFLKDRSF